MHNEVWKPILDYEGFYEVSTTGKVRGLNRAVTLPDGRTRTIKEKELEPKRNADNYLFVSLSRDGKSKSHYVHRLVALAFIINTESYPEVNHLSGDKSDNSVGNLNWVSHQQNVVHAYESGLNRNHGGTHCFAAQVIDNELGRTFETVKDWCIARGIAYSTGRNILNGSRKSGRIDLTSIVKVRKTNV